MKKELKDLQICENCGRNVFIGSGLFVNRVPDFDDYETRIEKGCPFPRGCFICRECEERKYKEEK